MGTHINRLPPETLASIMKETMMELLNGMTRRIPLDRGLSLVCRRWRETTISCSELWSVIRIPEDTPEWVQLCLDRCPFGPITLSVSYENRPSGSRPQFEQAVSYVLPQLSRARSLNLHLRNWDSSSSQPDAEADDILTRSLVDSLAAQSLPLLEDISMSFKPDLIDGDGANMIRLDSNILPGPMPHLSTVVLMDCFTVLPSSIYAASLRRLELYDVHGWNDVDGMIQCLQTMPVLEHLKYENYQNSELAPFDATRSRAHPPHCVRLDYLVNLDLNSVFNWDVVIFGYLAIPSSATIKAWHINDMDQRVPDDHLVMLGDALVEHFAPASRAGAHFNEVVIDHIYVEGRLASSGQGHSPHLPDVFCFALPLPTEIVTGSASEAHVLDFLDKFLTIPAIQQAGKVEFTADFLEWYPEYIPRYQSIFPAANLDSIVGTIVVVHDGL